MLNLELQLNTQFSDFSENQGGVDTRLHKLHLVREAQMQKNQFHGLNFVRVENTKKIQNALHSEPFLLLFLYLEPHVKSKIA